MRSARDWLRGVVTGCRLLRSPGELPAMVVALATGVGLTVAAYSLIHAVLIRPLPYSEPERLVQIWDFDPEQPDRRLLRDRNVDVLAEAPSAFQGVASHAPLERDLLPGPGRTPVQLFGAHVSVDLFTVLAVQAATGRTLRPEDSQLTNVSPIVVSERLVRSGLVSGRLGDVVDFEGASYRLIGTMPDTFWFPDRRTSFWVPVLVVPPEMLAPRERLGTSAPAVTGHVTMVAFVATVLVGLASCLPGAVAVARRRGSLHEGARAAAGGRWERSLMVVQASLVFALGAQAVLVALVLQSLVRTNVGFTKTDFLVVNIEPRGAAIIDANVQLARYKGLLEGLEGQGIRAAAASSFPFTRSGTRSTFEPRPSREHLRTMTRLRIVTPSYFQVTGMTATRGRLLTDGDVGSHLVVVNEAFLASVLPSETELGRRVGQNFDWTVVGVTRPVRHNSVHEEILAEAYLLLEDNLELRPASASRSMRSMYVLAETPRGVAATLRIIRRAVAEQMPEFTIRSATPVMDLIRSHMGRDRLVAAGAVVFAVISLLLAALGLYAMVSHGLALRGREIGVRMALGATVRRIAVDSARPVGIVYAVGVCLGTALLLAAMSAIRAVMAPPPGSEYPSLWAIGATSAAVLLVAFAAACYRPIRTATRVDPADSLRAN